MELSPYLSIGTFHLKQPLVLLCQSSSVASVPSSSSTASSHLSTSFTTTTINKQPYTKRPSNGPKRISVTYLSERKSALASIQNSSDLDSALERVGGVLNAQDMNAILRHFGKLERWKDLTKIFEWMQKQRKTNFASYSSYIKLMGRNLTNLKALEIYNSIGDESTKNNVSICNSVLSSLVRNGKFENSVKLFQQMKQDGLVPDVVTYSSLLSGCIKLKDGYSVALSLVQELQSYKLSLDSVIYATLIAICASNGRCKEAENYFNQMKEEGQCPNLFHYSSLLNAYSTGGDHKKADMLVQDMKSAGLVPNKVMLTTLLKVYVRGGLFEKSRELLTELEGLGYAKDEMPYCLLMDGLAKTGQIDEARLIFEQMKKKQVKSDGYSYSIMIAAFCRGGLLDEAKQLSKDFEATYDKYDLVILNTMLCAYCRVGEMDSVMQMMKKMDELAINPDYNTFHILIKYFCKEKLYMLAYQTMKDMHSKGHQPAEEICTSLIFHLGKTRAYAEAFSVYNMLRYGKRTMCKDLHEKILHILLAGRLLKDAYVVVKDNARLISRPSIKKFAIGFMKKGNVNLINDVIKAIHNSDYKIDQVLFEMAILRYIAEPEKKDLFLQLLKWMPGQGYAVDSTTRNLILKNSHLYGRQLVAEILAKQNVASKSLISHSIKSKRN